MKKFKVVLSLLLVVSILCLCGTALAKPPVGEFEFTVGGSRTLLSAMLTYEEDAHLRITYDPYFGFYNTEEDEIQILHNDAAVIAQQQFTGAISGRYTVAEAVAILKGEEYVPYTAFFQSCKYKAYVNDFNASINTKVYVIVP